MSYIYADFEYNSRAVLLGCFLNSDTGERHSFDFRQPGSIEAFAAFVGERRNDTWCAYAAMAEMASFLRLGVPLTGMRWIDLMAEASMISGTHSAFRLKRPKLLNHLDVFKVRAISQDAEARKALMRDLILSDPDEFTPEQWADITAYCWSDVEPLPALHDAIRIVHEDARTGYSDVQAITRGEYLKASAQLEHRTKGLPVDVEFIERIYTNRKAVRNALAQRCNEKYQAKLYEYNHLRQDYSFSFKGLIDYLHRLKQEGVAFEWERTASGRLRLDEEYLDQLVRENPELKEFHLTRSTLAQLNGDGLPKLVENGFIKPVSLPFYTVTGRNQPLVSRGFVLNMAPWLRHVVRPEPDHVLIAADWSKQEIALAVAFSGDEALRAAYETGDIYRALAEMAGAITAYTATDEAVLARQAYKAVQLGLGYGMGRVTLGRSLHHDLNEGSDTVVITRSESDAKAEEIYQWHQDTFVDYWRFLRGAAEAAKRDGFTSSLDDWLYFADRDTKFTRLMNFPMQSNGAVCLRQAIKALAKTDLNVVCTLHDAIYIYCHRDDADRHSAILKRIMDEAVRRVIGDSVKVDVDLKFYTHDTGYYDKRGAETLALVKRLLDDIEYNGAPILPPKPEPKRRKKVLPSTFADGLISFGEAA